MDIGRPGLSGGVVVFDDTDSGLGAGSPGSRANGECGSACAAIPRWSAHAGRERRDTNGAGRLRDRCR